MSYPTMAEEQAKYRLCVRCLFGTNCENCTGASTWWHQTGERSGYDIGQPCRCTNAIHSPTIHATEGKE